MKSKAPAGDVDGFGAMTIVSAMRRWGIVCVSALVLAACSGGDDDASSTTAAAAAVTTAAPVATTAAAETTEVTNPPLPTTAPTTEAPPTTVVPETTEPPATTAVPDTTEAPTTETTDASVEADVQARLDVLEQVEASWPAVRAVYNDPFNDDLVAALDGYFADRVREGLDNVVQQFRDGNFRTMSREDQPEIYRPDPRSLTIDLDAGRATVQACHVDTSILLLVGGNPDGSDEIRDDEISIRVEELDVELIDGAWKITRARAPETQISECP